MTKIELIEAIRALKFEDETRVEAINNRLDDSDREFEAIEARMVMTNKDLEFAYSL
jgi:hypothetical protein